MDPALIELNNGPRSDNALWKFRFETIEQAEAVWRLHHMLSPVIESAA
jgi:hypothetical protein